MKGKPWSVDEEKQLKEFVEAKAPLEVIMVKLHKSMDAIQKKCVRLGLEVVGDAKKNRASSTSSSGLKLPAELPSVEETLKDLSAALSALKIGGLDKTEILRLRSIISGCKAYKELLVDYMDYRGLEVEMLEWREKYADLVKKTSIAAPK